MTPRSGIARRIVLGVAAAAAFAAAYVLLAPPAREWVAQHAVAPLLAAVAAPSPGISVHARASPPAVLVSRGTELLATYSIPLGVLFFLPALLLLAVAPARPYWLLFAGYLVGVGLLDLAAVGAGIAWGSAGFTAHAFIEYYVIRPTSIAVPILFLEHQRRAARSIPGDTP